MFKIRQKESKILYSIKNCLGFGSVFLSKHNYYTYNVSSKNDLIKLINIFNGNLLLQKTNKRFENFVKEFNKHYNTNIAISDSLHLNKLDKQWLLNNSWLSGFTDADERQKSCALFGKSPFDPYYVGIKRRSFH
jgi:hypothetical protein